MENKSKLLPERMSSALRGLASRGFGVALLLFGVWFSFALIFHDPYMNGFAAASNMGNQSVVDHIVGFIRFGIGFVPTLFLFLCIMRTGISYAMNWVTERAPEYNLLRGFIAVCAGAAGFGTIFPTGNLGGLAGNIVANDIGSLVGPWAFVFGIAFLCLFFYLAGKLLNIKLANLIALMRVVYRAVLWVLSGLHLIKTVPAIPDDSDGEDDDDNADDDTNDQKTKPARAARKKPSTTDPVTPTVTSKPKSAIRNHKSEIYQLPPPEFLEKSVFGKNIVTPDMKSNASALEAHFEEFNVYGKVAGIKPGPVVTLYEFEPDNGVRNAKVIETVKDMTRAMATENIRIAHIPMTKYLGVEMLNLHRVSVRFQSLITNDDFVNSKYKIPLALGVNIAGRPVYFDLAKMPHLLIAGRTGSGKSVFVQSIIMSVVYHFTPDKCKLMIVDPKEVDFTIWNKIPHLITPVLTDPNSSVNALKWTVREMDSRYKKLAAIGVQNIADYNEKVADLRESGQKIIKQVAVGTDPETGGLEFEEQEVDLSDMPYLVVIIDEVADLMSVARKEVEACVQRLAQKARAAGIHLVMATQRPDTTVITGVIKSNFPMRISFQARSNIDSMTTLGEKGAEQLLGVGDMLFSEAGKPPVRIHSAWIENKEINRVVDFLRKQGEPEYIDGITASDDAMSGFDGGAAIPGMPASKDSKDADLYEQAKQYVIRDKKPTISYIQRRLGIGYNKAAGFMERMESDGIVSPPDANNKRQIL